MHPRLAVSEMCTYPLPFGDELALWDELGVRQVGLLTNNVDAFGRVAAIAALRERSMRATTVITTMFELSDPASWDATRAAVNDSIDLAAEVGGCTYFTPGRRDGRSLTSSRRHWRTRWRCSTRARSPPASSWGRHSPSTPSKRRSPS